MHTIHELQSSITACLQDSVHVLIALQTYHTASLALLLRMRQDRSSATNWVCTENRTDASKGGNSGAHTMAMGFSSRMCLPFAAAA